MEALFGFTGPYNPDRFESMQRKLSHRGNSHLQQCTGERFNVFYLDNYQSKQTRQTAATRGSIHLAYAGIVFGNAGRPLEAGDLLQRYKDSGLNFINQIRGFFVLVLHDDGKTYLVRDGSGRRTLYFAVVRDQLCFAVEPKALTGLNEFEKRIHPASIAQYLSFSFVPGRHTMLEDLYEVPAGHWMEFADGHVNGVHRYFRFEEEEKNPIEDRGEAVKEFERLLETSMREMLDTTATTAVFLSGGLDSSVITAKLAQLSSRPVHTFSLHFGENYPHELDYARMVADRYRTQHHEIRITPKEFIPRLRQAIWHLDDPIGDPVTVPNFELASKLAGQFEFVFNGEGGDPCFGGPKNLPMMLAHWYGGILRGPFFREREYLMSYRRAYEELHYLLSPDVLKRVDEEQDLYRILTPFFECALPGEFLHKLLTINIRLKGAHLILPKIEKMLGAWNLVPLSPLFDERLVRLSFRIPGRMKLASGIEKIVMKEAFHPHLPEEIIGRPKSGMRVPVYFWFQKEMKSYARSILSRKNIQRAGIFRWERVKQLLDYNIEEGPGRYGLRLWMLITFELWRRIVVDNEPV